MLAGKIDFSTTEVKVRWGEVVDCVHRDPRDQEYVNIVWNDLSHRGPVRERRRTPKIGRRYTIVLVG